MKDELIRKLENTKRGSLLLDKHQKLIKTKPEYFDSPQRIYRHPMDEIFVKAFLHDDASIAVLADGDVLHAFQSCDALADMPYFYLAGARSSFYFNPSELKVGILTAGGNAPGLDTIVDAIVKHQFLLGTEHCIKAGKALTPEGYPPDLKFYGIRGGYRGLRDLSSGEDREWVMELHPRLTDTWALRGCSTLHALRTDDRDFDEFINKLAAKVRLLDLDILYTIGGNGTLKVANALGQKLREDGKKPCAVVAGPKTMDNDINFTDFTFGFRTTVDNAIKVLCDFHREAETLERIGVVELFGADSGFVALHAAYACGEADYVLIPEMMGDNPDSAAEELETAISNIKKRADKKGHALLVVAEGATLRLSSKSYRHGMSIEQERAFMELVDRVRQQTGHSVFYNQPKHLIRATPPGGFDIDLCKYTGKLMVDTALAGFTKCAVHLWQGNYVLVPLETAIAELKRVDVNGYYFISMRERYLLAK